MNSAGAYNTTPDMMFSFWESLDYRLADILGRETDAAEFTANSYRQEICDYLAIPKERIASVIEKYRQTLPC